MKSAVRTVSFDYPAPEKWFLNYNALDAIFKHADNPVYRKMYSLVAQATVRKLADDWKGYFAASRDYKQDPAKYLGKPRMPGYSRQYATAAFNNQASRLLMKNGMAYILFKGNEQNPLCIGKAEDFRDAKYVRSEIKPTVLGFEVCVTVEDGAAVPKEPEHPERMVGIDIGLDNLAAVTNNFGAAPLIIRGGMAKSMNQYYNKQTASLRSILLRGNENSKGVHMPLTNQMAGISRDRQNAFRDMFYKCAWQIVRFAKENHADVIVVGYNPLQKQEIDLGKKTNQAFVSIPYAAFRSCLTSTAAKEGIPVVLQEESYTSKASILDMDKIPTYRKNQKSDYIFSGQRIKRGCYRSKDGILLNADINAAANIIRKKYPYAFDGVKDLSYLYKTTLVMPASVLQPCRPTKKSVRHQKPKPGRNARWKHGQRQKQRMEMKKAFQWTRPTRAEQKARTIQEKSGSTEVA
jgi:putative transposase